MRKSTRKTKDMKTIIEIRSLIDKSRMRWENRDHIQVLRTSFTCERKVSKLCPSCTLGKPETHGVRDFNCSRWYLIKSLWWRYLFIETSNLQVQQISLLHIPMKDSPWCSHLGNMFHFSLVALSVEKISSKIWDLIWETGRTVWLFKRSLSAADPFILSESYSRR